LDGVAAGAYPWIQRVHGTQSGTTRQYIFLLFAKGMCHFFPFSLSLIILVFLGPFDIYYHFHSIPCVYLNEQIVTATTAEVQRRHCHRPPYHRLLWILLFRLRQD